MKKKFPLVCHRFVPHLLVLVGLGIAIDLFAVLISRDWCLSGVLTGKLGVAARLVALGGLGWVLIRSVDWKDRHAQVLVLLMLVITYQFHTTDKRMVADGYSYFAYVQSFWKDFDVDFANEYHMYGIDDHPSRQVPTRTGHRRSIFSAGPAVFWSPFYLLGELCGRVAAWSGREVNLRGNGPFHWNAVAVGTLAYGFAAVFLMQSLLRRYFEKTVAFAGAALAWLGTNLHWYMVYQPWMSHAIGTFTAAWFLWYWDRGRLRRGWRRAFLLGLIGGLMVCVRWQNGLILFLPFMDWLWGLWKRDRGVAVAGPVVLAGFVLGLSPQLLAWKAIYGQYLLLDPPHGAGFVRYFSPFALETLFSSRHGLLSWTPILWLGFIGLVPLLKRRWTPAWMMVFCLVLMTYVNMCITDWWASNSFSNRRFDGALPIFAFGIAASFEVLLKAAARRPALAVGALLAFFPVWNLLFMEQYHQHRIPIDDTVSFADVAANGADLLFGKVGYPFAWPVNWWFAWAYDTSPASYDKVVGRYLFFPHRDTKAVMEIGEDDGGLIGEGWNPPELRAGRWVRVTRRNKARLFIPLERYDIYQVSFRLSVRPRPVDVVAKVNGQEVGSFRATPGYAAYSVRTPKVWRRGVNTLDVEPRFEAPRHILLLDEVTFERGEPGGGAGERQR